MVDTAKESFLPLPKSHSVPSLPHPTLSHPANSHHHHHHHKSTTSIHPTALPPTRRRQPATHAATLRQIESLADLAGEPCVQSIKGRKLAHLPSAIYSIDQNMRHRNNNSPLHLHYKERQSLKLLKRMDRSIQTVITHRYQQQQKKQQHKHKQQHATLIALRKTIRIDQIDRHRFSTLLRKELRSTMAEYLVEHQHRQQEWLKIVTHVVWLNIHKNRWEDIVSNRKKERERNCAIAKLQSGWKSSYSKRMDAKHERTYALLRQRAWVARLNVRTRKRGHCGHVVRSFLMSYGDSNRFLQCIRLYKWRVIRCQRATRNYFNIRNARLALVLKMWNKYEPTVLIDLELEERKKERHEEKQAKLKRMNLTEEQMKTMQEMEALTEKAAGKDSLLKGKTRQRPTSARPVNVRLVREQRRQAAILERCTNLNALLETRDQLIQNDIASEEDKKNSGEWTKAVKKKSRKVRPRSSLGTRSKTRTLAPGMRLTSSSKLSRVVGPLAVAKKQLYALQQRKELQQKRAVQHQEQSEKNQTSQRQRRGSVHRQGVVSRFEPLNKRMKRRVILGWLSAMLRQTWKEYEEKVEEIYLAPAHLSVTDMKEMMSEDGGGGGGGGVDSFFSSLKSPNAKPVPPFVFPLFSKHCSSGEIQSLIRSGHQKYLSEQKVRRVEEKAHAKNAMRTSCVATSPTLRHLLGDDLIESVSGFCREVTGP